MRLTPLLQQAEAAYARGDFAGAESLCVQALAADGGNIAALNLLATLLARRRQPAQAAAVLARALALAPSDPVLHDNFGLVLRDLGRLREAADSHARAFALDPRYAPACSHRGSVLRELGDYAGARACFEQVIALQPQDPGAHYNLGVVLQDSGRVDAALESYARTLALRPNHAEALYNQAAGQRQQHRLEEAVRSYTAAIEARPRFAEAYNNRGSILAELGAHGRALQDFAHALQLNPRLVEAHLNAGHALATIKRPAEAVASYERALQLAPAWPELLGSLVYAQLLGCHWPGLESRVARLEAGVASGATAAQPFHLLAVCDSPSILRQCSESAALAIVRRSEPATPVPRRARREVIRLGYFSADFHVHATAHLLAGVLESHDRGRFGVVAFSFGPEHSDPMRTRVSAAVDRFIDVRSQSDQEVAGLARTLEIDIALDLKGFTQHARPGIFAARAAPIQVNYLGYPGTMGRGLVDYMVVDHDVAGAAQRDDFAERLLWLPHSYQPNDRKRQVAASAGTREQHDLPREGFVFCCFNSNYKITPAVFDQWMRMLKAVEGSTLWLLADATGAVENLRREAHSRGVDGARLVAARPMPLAEHLARHRHADLFLDTYPCGAHTTASDALWAGVPLLTRPGRSFASRVGASLLQAVGLPELIASTAADYESLAITLAHEPGKLRELRERLERQRASAPLFDVARYTRHLEAGFASMYDRYQSGLEPADIVVQEEPCA
jgi:predicted O-linked N-acetylglucosamine transferase (SPINDLY family)